MARATYQTRLDTFNLSVPHTCTVSPSTIEDLRLKSSLRKVARENAESNLKLFNQIMSRHTEATKERNPFSKHDRRMRYARSTS